MQSQVETRIQLTVMVNHNIILGGAIRSVVQRFYGDTAFLRPGRTIHGDYTIVHRQFHVLLGINRVCRL